MKLYVIAVSGMDSDGSEVDGLLTSNAVIEKGDLQLRFTPRHTVDDNVDESSHVLTQFSLEVAQRLNSKLIEYIRDLNITSLQFTVESYDFSSAQITAIARANCTRLDVHSEEVKRKPWDDFT